jgi:hypothetical protein
MAGAQNLAVNLGGKAQLPSAEEVSQHAINLIN